MMVEPWPVKYIGLPWIPEEHHCYVFARKVWLEETGTEVEVININAASALAIGRFARKIDVLEKWERIETPEEYCGVFMGQSESLPHVGVWSEFDGGKILHCVKGAGVIFTYPSVLPLMGIQLYGFYRRKK